MTDLIQQAIALLREAQKELLVIKDDAFCDHAVGICSCSYWATVERIDRFLEEIGTIQKTHALVPIDSLKRWLELLDQNPSDIKPRIESMIAAAQEETK